MASLSALLAALLVALSGSSTAGLGTITSDDLEAYVQVLAGPGTEGRDSPSADLDRAARYIAQRFAAAGMQPAPDVFVTTGAIEPTAADVDAYLRSFERILPRPVASGCALELELADGTRQPFEFGDDFVPVAGYDGTADGELAFAGYGVKASGEGYDDLAGLDLRKRIVLIVWGEPEHARRFEGPQVSPAASLWRKLEDLDEAGAAGVLVVRRDIGVTPQDGEQAQAGERPLGFRHTWARFVGGNHRPPAPLPFPVLEIDEACADRLLGTSLAEIVQGIDARARPVRHPIADRRVHLQATTEEAAVAMDNVLGWIPGSDPELADEVVFIGAHYDHIGVDERGRIGFGADDNASGVAVLIELAEALVVAQPRRSMALCAFAAEEDGLLGAKAVCGEPPVPMEQVVAMINMDMIGRGKASEVAVIGVRQTKSFERLLKRAQRESPTGVRKIITKKGEELFTRSDHYAFYEKGVPVLFFFEGVPISRNKDYHTWRDTIEQLDFDKIHNTARLVFNTAWLLANDDDRPPRPR